MIYWPDPKIIAISADKRFSAHKVGRVYKFCLWRDEDKQWYPSFTHDCTKQYALWVVDEYNRIVCGIETDS